jgi:hypothetical protein
MKMTQTDVEQLRSAFAVCRTAGIDAVVITDNKVRGITQTAKMAIISEVKLSFDPTMKIGIGRIGELEKRLAIFTSDVSIEGKVNDNNEVSVLTITAGKSKVQFRCTSEKMIKYPKSNDDPAVCVITATKAEINQIARATKTLGAEVLTIAIGRDSTVKFECSASTNEAFGTALDAEASFVDEPQAIVHIYEGDRFATVLDAAAREADEVSLVLGDFGSITVSIKGHTILAMPEANQEDDDE